MLGNRGTRPRTSSAGHTRVLEGVAVAVTGVVASVAAVSVKVGAPVCTVTL